MGFRCTYSLDGQGYDFSSSYAKKYAKKTNPVAIPTKRPEFTRCAYSLDSQGHDLSYPKQYSSSSATPTLSRENSNAMLGDDGEWRAVYDLGQRPLHEKHPSETSTMSTNLEQRPRLSEKHSDASTVSHSHAAK